LISITPFNLKLTNSLSCPCFRRSSAVSSFIHDNLAAWSTRRLEKMGLCCRSGNSNRMAFFKLLSSPLVHVFLNSGHVEFMDKAGDGESQPNPDDEPS